MVGEEEQGGNRPWTKKKRHTQEETLQPLNVMEEEEEFALFNHLVIFNTQKNERPLDLPELYCSLSGLTNGIIMHFLF